MNRSLALPTVSVAAAAAGFVVATALAPGQGAADPELVLLIRFMAVLKAGMALVGVALSSWRLTYPASPRMAAGYGLACVLMAAAPGLIWEMSHLIAGAAVFHAGLALFLGCAWADRGAATEMFARRVARRRTAPPRAAVPANDMAYSGRRS